MEMIKAHYPIKGYAFDIFIFQYFSVAIASYLYIHSPHNNIEMVTLLYHHFHEFANKMKQKKKMKINIRI